MNPASIPAPPVDDVVCPRCTGRLTRRSRRRTARDYMAGILGLRPFRCEDCDLRFYCPFRTLPTDAAQA